MKQSIPGIRPLSPKLEAASRKNINEVPERRQEDLARIREWILTQPHLTARTDDAFLLIFLRGCKFSLEKTKEKIDAYYTYRTALPEFFSNRDPMLPELQTLLNTAMVLTLDCEPDCGPLWLYRPSNFDPKVSNVNDVVKVMFMMVEIVLMESEESVIYGQNLLIDLENVSMSHLLQLSPLLIKKLFQVWQAGYPCRPQAMNFINTPSFFETLLSLMRSLLKEKLKARFFLHPNIEALQTDKLRSILPTEYGGDAGSMKSLGAAWKAKIESYRDYFLEDEKYCVDESKRPGKPKTVEEMFGAEGSFRSLQVD
ncbi:retinol-binding protein pinta [Anabrus simplex]|uniref:retinol-binding protein pinta n=1 Tax=Anabrus simplex TaxID=316456 RepID=UPI0035A3C67D